MPDEMDEIVAEFVTEAEESLGRVEPLFVELESRGSDFGILNEIFRCMHTLKGAAGFLGFQQIVDVAHGAESVLKKLRDGEIDLSKPRADAILRSVDVLRRLVARVKAKDPGDEDTRGILAELEAAQGATPGDGGDGTPPPAERVAASPANDAGDTGPAPPAAQRRGAPEVKGGRATVRVDVDRIDKVMDLAGEVVLVRNRLLNLVEQIGSRHDGDPAVHKLFDAVSFLDRVASDMQLAVMRMRMQPLRNIFSRFPRLVRDLAKSLGKDVELRIWGEDTEVDRSIIERIGDPMVHLIRNAIDHGLESRQERLQAGKRGSGTIAISAAQVGNQIVIEVSDDGRGIDLDRVRAKAAAKGLVKPEEAARMTDDAAIELLFRPGFSTKDAATELSGRGVGMDVVKTNISQVNGFVEVSTVRGAGTTFRISIPLTLAIIRVLLVQAAGATYAIPLALVREIVRVSPDEIGLAAGQRVLVIRDRIHPFIEVGRALGREGADGGKPGFAAVIAVGENRFCAGVDSLGGEEEIVIKTIEGGAADAPCVAGATITGDGNVVLVLDMAALFRAAAERARQ